MNKQVNTKATKLVRIDAGLHKILKLRATSEETSIRALLEESLADHLFAKSISTNAL